MIAVGNKDDAADFLRANLEAVKERMNEGTMNSEEVAFLHAIALGYMLMGHLESVESVLELVSLYYYFLC